MVSKATTGKDFSFDSIEDFDEHISSSIPAYGQLRKMVLSISTYFVHPRGVVYDLGCSTGQLLKDIMIASEPQAKDYVGYDISSNLLPTSDHALRFEQKDITDPSVRLSDASLVICLFTLQFLSPRDRQPLLKRVYDNLEPGGALIVAEKVYASTGVVNELEVFAHYDHKLKEFDAETIFGKQRRLRSIMRPSTEQTNIEALYCAGFKVVEPVWRCLNFAAWIALK